MTLVVDDHSWTREERDALPDDGHRYEIVDGVLVVSPAPRPRHQRVVMELGFLLRTHCPAELEVLPAPLDVVLAGDTVVQPDLLVARRADLTERDLSGPPVLAVEVLSPSSQVVDRNLKLHRYERAGCPSYWLVDPGDGVREARLTAYELRGETYEVVAHVEGAAAWTARVPFEVTVVPAALVT